MPVVAVALAAGSFAAGATAFAAATTLAASVAAGAMMAGAALTIVGTITKNPKLAKIGAIISIAGGIGTMAINMTSGAASAASAAEGAASGAAEVAAGATEGLAAAAGDAAVQTYGIAQPTTDILASAGAVDAAAGAGQAAASGGGMIESAIKAGADTAGQAAAGATDHLTNAAGTFQTKDVLTGSMGDLARPIDIAKPVGVDAFAVPYAVDGAAKTGMLGSISTWARQNPELAKMAMSGVQGLAGSIAPSAKDKAMMDAYRSQQAQTEAQTEALNRRARWGSGRI